MKISRLAKMARSIEIAAVCVFFSALAWGSSPHASFRPTFECGDYTVRGELHLSEEGFFILSVRPRTTAAYELILLGGDLRENLTYEGVKAEVQIYVPKKIADDRRPIAYLQKIGPDSVFKPEWELIKLEACSNSKRYR